MNAKTRQATNQNFINKATSFFANNSSGELLKQVNRYRLLVALVLVSCLCVSFFLVRSQASSQTPSLGSSAQINSKESNANLFSYFAQPQPFVIGTCDVATAGLPIEVEATAGTLGPTAYSNLGAAFTAINSGTHQGAINIEVCFNSTEGTTPATLNSSGAGSASYTSLSIRPLADGLTITGNPATGFGVIQLKGADNVTIDGDNPNTGGTNRNLTVNNTNTTTAIAGSVIRIATAATVVTSADNITLKNMNLNGNVTAGNSSLITSTTGSSNSSFVIYAGGNGGSTATDAPTAITSVTANTAPSGTTINGLVIDNNVLNQAARAIVFNGAASSVATGLTITNNLIGDQGTVSGTPPITTPTTTVYTKGIWVAGTNAVTISGNSLKSILSYVATTMTGIELNTAIGTGTVNVNNNTVNGLINNGTSVAQAIAVSSAASGATFNVNGNTVANIQAVGSSVQGITVGTSATSGNINNNNITTVRSRSTGGVNARGIAVTSGSAVTIQNNFIAEVLNIGSASFGTSFNANGILLLSGNSHKVYHNTVNLFGTSTSVGSNSINCLAISSSSQTGIDVRNNIFSNTVTGGAATDAHVGVFLPFAASGTMLLTLNNNAYYTGTIAGKSGIAFAGTSTYAAASVYDVASFNPGATTPSTNFRSYSSALGVASNDNASLGFTSAAPFVSSTDLHISTGVTPTQLESGGASVGVTTDIDGHTRPGPTGSTNGGATAPDIGADEFDGVPLDIIGPAITYTPFSNTTFTTNRVLSATITDASGVASGGNAPRIYFKKNAEAYVSTACTGTYSCTVDYSMVGGGSVTTGDVISYFVVAQDTIGNLSFNPSAGATGTNVNTVTMPPTTPNTYSIVAAFPTSVNVGSAETYTSLTNNSATGLFKALNSAVLNANVTINVTSDLTIEDGAVALNQWAEEGAGNYTVTIKAAGGSPRTISGTSLGATALITLNGADRVIFDGTSTSISPQAAGDNLTIINNSTNAASAVIWVQTATGSNSATNNIFKNLNITGNASTTTLFGIGFGGTSISTSSLGTGNNNNTVESCDIQKAQYGIYSQGASAANKNTGNVITQNTMNAVSPNNIQLGGILVGFENNITISENNISNLTTTGDIFGISVGLGNSFVTTTTVGNEVTNATVSKNVIGSVVSTSTTGFTAIGIGVGAQPSGSTTTVSNNMISGVLSFATPSDFIAGIHLGGGAGTTNVYFNSVSMTGAKSSGTSGGTSPSYALSVAGTTPVVDIRNNILVNSQTSGNASPGRSFAIGLAYTSTLGNYLNLTSNNNDLFVSGAQGVLGKVGSLSQGTGTEFASLIAWQTETGRDGASVSGDPKFMSLTDLHISTTMTTPVESAGVPIAGITVDIDMDTRNATTPDIGADEGTFIAPVANDVQATAFIDPTNGGSKIAGVAFSPQASFTNNGTMNQTSVPVRYRICTDGSCTTEVYNQATTIATLNSGSTATATFASAMLSAGTYTIKAKAELVGDTVPANDEITGTLIVQNPLSGNYTVGSGGNYSTLTAAIAALNSLGVGGATTLTLTDASYTTPAETFPLTINAVPGASATNTVTIKPGTGVTSSISGSSATCVINLNGADYITIDGSNTVGGTSRDLTITNTNAGTASAVVCIESLGAGLGATNNTVKNTNLVGSTVTATNGTLFGVFSGSTTIGSASNGPDNDNNTIQNNNITKTQYGIYSGGESAANKNTGTVITQNVMNAASPNNLNLGGIFVRFEDSVQISQNDISVLRHDGTTGQTGTVFGIALGIIPSNTVTTFTGSDVTGAMVTKNKISGLTQLNSTGYSAFGIVINSVTSGTTLVANNMVSVVRAASTASDFSAGIVAGGGAGSTTQIYHNSVSMTGTRGAATYPSYGLAINSGDPIVDVRNNIFYNTQTSSSTGKMYAIATGGTTFVNLTSDFNDFFVTGANAFVGQTGGLGTAGTDRTALSDWQTATGKDGTSISSDPLFVSTTDLHLQSSPLSPAVGSGTMIAAVTNDFDMDPRPASNPDIGADELVQATLGMFPAGTFYNALTSAGNSLSGNVTITGSITLNGVLNTFGNTLTIGCNAVVNNAGSSNYVNGTVRKDFCTTGSFQFPLGGGVMTLSGNSTEGVNQFTPVTANITALGVNPSSLTATVNVGIAPATPPLDPGITLNRYWSLTEIGDVTADLTFQYLQGDVNGTESNYNIYRIPTGGGTPVVFPSTKQSPCNLTSPCIDTTNNIMFIGGVKNYSNWLAGGLAPTASIAEIGGRIRTANGQPIVGALMSSRNLSNGQRLTSTTDSTGRYNFGGQTVANDYAIAPVLNGYRFEPNQQVISLNGNRSDVDFIAIETTRNPSNDYDGDGIADLAVFRPSEGNWYIWQSSTSSLRVENWGVATDRIVPADYDGDGKMDVAVYRPSEGNWYIKESFNGRTRIERWGLPTDRVVPADYDGDGRTDIAVYRQSDNVWYVKRSSDGTVQYETLSLQVTKPVIGDFDGDRRADIAGVVNTNGQIAYVIKGSRTNTVTTESWGLGSDSIMSGDYDNDGRTDYAVYRASEGVWYIKTATNTITRQWGVSTDEPLNGDYDGNGISDFAVYRVENGHGYFYILGDNGQYRIHQFGLAGDIPIGRDVIR